MEFFQIVDVHTTENIIQKRLKLKNRERKQKEFVEEIHLFLEDLNKGLVSCFS
jgi:hypothetical protein